MAGPGGGPVDKGLLPLAGWRVIDHVLERLAPQVGAVALNLNGDPARWPDLGLPVLPDSLPDHPGPLAGVLAGMDWAAAKGAPAVISVAADTPFFPRDLVAGLTGAAGPAGLCLAACRDADTGRLWPQPTFGLWPVGLRQALRAALIDGQRKVRLWAETQGAAYAIFDEDAFFNVNTPADLAQAEARARAD